MDGKTRSSVQLLVADVTLEMFGLLMVDEYLVIIELPVAVPPQVKGVNKLGGRGLACIHNISGVIAQGYSALPEISDSKNPALKSKSW